MVDPSLGFKLLSIPDAPSLNLPPNKSRGSFFFFADFFDACWSDDGGFVAEGVSDEGEDGGDFFVVEHFEGRSGFSWRGARRTFW